MNFVIRVGELLWGTSKNSLSLVEKWQSRCIKNAAQDERPAAVLRRRLVFLSIYFVDLKILPGIRSCWEKDFSSF
jgi:hypothetical protein